MAQAEGQAGATRAPALPDDELTLHLIASGLIRLVQRVAGGAPIGYPYPVALQRGLDRLALACWRRGQLQPQGVNDLIGLAQRPLAEWPLQLPAETIGRHDRLLDGETPTSVCDAWACASPDVEAELSEQRIILSTFEICRALNNHAAYVAFRRLLISQPVLTALDLQLHCIDLVLTPLADQLREAYALAPEAWAVDGSFACCPHCDGLLQPGEAGGWHCESERCRRKPAKPPQRYIPAHEDVLWLKRGLRRFVAAPGKAELRLAERLSDLGLEVELWPHFDRYDLRVSFPDGEVWAIDVKDWANPFLLARQVTPVPSEPPWNLAYFVFPDERVQERRDYVRAFRNACSILNNRTQAIAERELVKAARAKLSGRDDA